MDKKTIDEILKSLLDADSACFEAGCKQQSNTNFGWLLGFGAACVACYRALNHGEPGIIKEALERHIKDCNK